MNFMQSLKMALKSMRTSKMRTFLTMLGVIIGVASVIVLVSLVNGFKNDLYIEKKMCCVLRWKRLNQSKTLIFMKQ